MNIRTGPLGAPARAPPNMARVIGPDSPRRRPYSPLVESVSVLAIGVDLDLVSTEDGGRTTPLRGGYAEGSRLTYRPNWGLPHWPHGEQTAGPVLGFSRTNIHPGDCARAILVPLFLDHAPDWRDVGQGDDLRMYEGPRLCGQGRVRWIEPATWEMPDDEQQRLVQWLAQPSSGRPLTAPDFQQDSALTAAWSGGARSAAVSGCSGRQG
jgi:hypothetical protein